VLLVFIAQTPTFLLKTFRPKEPLNTLDLLLQLGQNNDEQLHL
jgi:hypothetical protein